MQEIYQIEDEMNLLNLMISDSKNSSELFKPTNYWKVYEKQFIPELKKLGLKNFRQRHNSVLSSFGATDLSESARIDLRRNRYLYNSKTRKIPYWKKIIYNLSSMLTRILPVFPSFGLSEKELLRLMFYRVKNIGEQFGARPISDISVSLNGSPEMFVVIEDKVYTASILHYYLRYVYVSKFIDFDQIDTIVELGSGSGKQIELLKKLYPKINFLLFDIPPQLYVCEQYLKSVFPGDVVSYNETRTMDTIPSDESGKIFMLGNWKFPILENMNIDLFWNAASFQEMEPKVVLNYLSYVNKCAKAVYLQEAFGGKEVAIKKGNIGVLNQVVLKHYTQGLSNFKIIDESPSVFASGKEMVGYSDTFWNR